VIERGYTVASFIGLLFFALLVTAASLFALELSFSLFESVGIGIGWLRIVVGIAVAWVMARLFKSVAQRSLMCIEIVAVAALYVGGVFFWFGIAPSHCEGVYLVYSSFCGGIIIDSFFVVLAGLAGSKLGELKQGKTLRGFPG